MPQYQATRHRNKNPPHRLVETKALANKKYSHGAQESANGIKSFAQTPTLVEFKAALLRIVLGASWTKPSGLFAAREAVVYVDEQDPELDATADTMTNRRYNDESLILACLNP